VQDDGNVKLWPLAGADEQAWSVWRQPTAEPKRGKNRNHLDLVADRDADKEDPVNVETNTKTVQQVYGNFGALEGARGRRADMQPLLSSYSDDVEWQVVAFGRYSWRVKATGRGSARTSPTCARFATARSSASTSTWTPQPRFAPIRGRDGAPDLEQDSLCGQTIRGR
jgi:hypothetical protein